MMSINIQEEITSEKVVDSGLQTARFTNLETIGYIVGTNIGAGVLGLAFAARKAGFVPMLISLLITYIVCTISMLYVAEVCLRTKGNRQLSGLTEKYLGKIGSWVVFLGIAGSCYGALIAYIAGSGDILYAFFGDYGLSRQMGGLLFLIPALLPMYIGFKALGVSQKIISTGMTAVIAMLIIATIFHSDTTVENLLQADWAFIVPIFNVAVFILAAQFLVPEIVRGNMYQPKKIPMLIIVGMGIVLLIVVIIPASVIALVGIDNIVDEVATLTWGGKLGPWAFYASSIFAFLALLTSYWGMGGALFSNIFDHLKLGSETNKTRRILALALVTLPPLLLAFFDQAGFVNALYFAGTVDGFVMGLIPIFLLHQARKHGDRTPEYQVGFTSSIFMQVVIAAIFVFASCYAVAELFGMLPASW